MAKEEKVQAAAKPTSKESQPPPVKKMLIIGGVTLTALLMVAKRKDLAVFFEGKFKRSEVIEQKQPAPEPEKAQPLTAFEARERVGDIAELKRLAFEKKKDGERIQKIVMAGENIAKVLYVSSQDKTQRTEAFMKEQGKWQ